MPTSAREKSASLNQNYPRYQITNAPFVADPAIDLTNLGLHLRTDGSGADVVLYAAHAERVDFVWRPNSNNKNKAESTAEFIDSSTLEYTFQLLKASHGIWHGFIPKAAAGDAYGFRVHGLWEPASGYFHNPAKLLLDPYGRGYTGEIKLLPPVYAHQVNEDLQPVDDGTGQLLCSNLDSGPYTVWSVMIDDTFPAIHPAPKLDPSQRIIYEAHVRGLTKQLPGLPAELQGTYAGLAHPITLNHLKKLGVTTIELLPIHACAPEPFLAGKGIENYWGYNTMCYFSPNPAYATADAQAAGAGAVLNELKGMVSILHENGFEVVMDVVYNHTCEGGKTGPTTSLRGIDNRTYYLANPDQPGDLYDTTGCGNTIDFRQLAVMQLTLDSLRYWVEKVGIDGFRFDLAVTLGRQRESFYPSHPFLMACATDPVLRRVQLIAEPWDMGPDGWRTGQFPYPFADWNDRFRDTVRGFWLVDGRTVNNGGQGSDARDLATRLSGSADLFSHCTIPGGRGPLKSINFISAHDGFTLYDLVSYDQKHNEANGEENRDGNNNNSSWNHGIEGCSNLTPEIIAARQQTLRNLFATLLISAGTPMFNAGDEIGRSQQGNNNAYCQNNQISWINWQLETWQTELLSFVSKLIALRRQHPVIRPNVFAQGIDETHHLVDLAWFDATANPFTASQWQSASSRVLQMYRNGALAGDHDALLLINGSGQAAEFKLVDCRVEIADLDPQTSSEDSSTSRLNNSGNFSSSTRSTWTLQFDTAKPDYLTGNLQDLQNESSLAEIYSDVRVPSLNTYSGGDSVVLAPLSMQLYLSSKPHTYIS